MVSNACSIQSYTLMYVTALFAYSAAKKRKRDKIRNGWRSRKKHYCIKKRGGVSCSHAKNHQRIKNSQLQLRSFSFCNQTVPTRLSTQHSTVVFDIGQHFSTKQICREDSEIALAIPWGWEAHGIHFCHLLHSWQPLQFTWDRFLAYKMCLWQHLSPVVWMI